MRSHRGGTGQLANDSGRAEQGEGGGVRDERAVRNAGTNKQVICKAMEDTKEMNSTTRKSVT